MQNQNLCRGEVPETWVLINTLGESDVIWTLLLLSLFCCSVVSNSFRPHGLQNARPPCPSPSPGAFSNHVHWIGGVIQASHPLLSPSPPAFNLSQHQGLLQCLFFVSGGQRIGASISVLPVNIQDWLPLGWTGWISLLSKGLSKVFSNTTVQKHQFFSIQLSLWSNSHIHTWQLEKP